MAQRVSEITHLRDLTPDPKNARRHNPRNVGMVVDALHEVGAARSIVIDEFGVVLAGNATIEAAGQAGIERVQVVDADGDTIIAVRRSGLTSKQKKRLALFDNRAAELADWDVPVLLDEPDLLAGLFREDEQADLLASLLEPKLAGAGGDEFDATPADGPTRVQPGDVWRVGQHRLMCGDSTKAEDVARLMDGEKPNLVYTDPPYGVDYDGGRKVREKLAGDANTDIYGAALSVLPFDNDTPLYLWYALGMSVPVYTALERYGWEIRAVIIWNKNQAQFGALSAHYKEKKEPLIYAFRKGRVPAWYGPTNEVTVWDCSRANSNDFHPTQKPVELAERAIGNSSRITDIVLDVFLGSGATLIAAERTARKCYGMEIEPKYCDVILRRAEAEGIAPIERVI